ncbi:endonuclease/exonuclease/phosphatase family protein [Streptococcus loxodontisalivarius]|uniref:Maltose 6'-phosphate phosphatase n=1 Tax=Streptococcus loxodontisalivarius TaxID=1349415 RepID=A0ABS2PRU8_9STRE|nr:endonuclease/exonuclease/phosphatase family protein [Streptococcus loxodontisalivarius]MBM7642285.1 maltose 6'-phosphate phosphatase [Streptococcus loxodontisalivarius]
MVKCLSLNTHSWMEEDFENKYAALLDRLKKEAYDIICLQEINQLMTSQEVANPLNYVALAVNPPIHEDNFALKLVTDLAKAGLTYHWSWAYNHIGYDKYHEGVALLSLTEISPRDILVSDVDDETDYHTRRLLSVETVLGNSRASFTSLHLSWWDKGFQGEWRKLEAALSEEDCPLVLMGDFNNPTDQEGYQAVLASSLKLADSHKIAAEVSGDFTITADIDGWEGNSQQLKVDHAFVSQGITLKSSKVIFDGENSPVVSDHFGLEIELEL